MLRYHMGYGSDGGRHGKRLRPRMLLTTALAEASEHARETVLRDALAASCAIEILHNYSLVHDDIEDGDELRHGRQTVWAKYGMPHGINTGDALCAISYLALLRPGRISDPARAARLAACLHEANLAMVWGQGLDLGFENAAHVTYSEYLTMIAGKTAALFGCACALGAIAAGNDETRTAAYARMGEAYGQAFQIYDDILGMWGDSGTTGKPCGADVRRRKWSFPIVWALEYGADGPDRRLIGEAYAERKVPAEDDVARILHSLEHLGARAAADAAGRRALTEAGELAATAGLDRDGALRELLRANMDRRA